MFSGTGWAADNNWRLIRRTPRLRWSSGRSSRNSSCGHHRSKVTFRRRLGKMRLMKMRLMMKMILTVVVIACRGRNLKLRWKWLCRGISPRTTCASVVRIVMSATACCCFAEGGDEILLLLLLRLMIFYHNVFRFRRNIFGLTI